MKRTWRLSCTADGNTYDLRFGIGVHTLGSAATSDLRISDPTVSRSHARLTCTDEGITVEDLGSTNGTAVDGTPVDGPVASPTTPSSRSVGWSSSSHRWRQD